MKDYLRLLGYAVRYRGTMSVLALCVAVSFPITVVAIELTRRLLNTVTEGSLADAQLLLVLALSLIAAELLGQARVFVQQEMEQRLFRNVANRLKVEAFQHVLSVPVSFFDKHNPRTVISRIEDDVSAVGDAGFKPALEFAHGLLWLGVGLWGTFQIDWRLALLYIAFMPIQWLVMSRLGRRGYRMQTDHREGWAKYNTALSEAVHGVREIIAYGQEQRETDRHAQRADALSQQGLLMQRTFRAMNACTRLIGRVTTTVVYGIGGYLVLTRALGVGDLIAFLQYANMLGAPIGILSGQYANVQKGLAAARRVFEILDMATASKGESRQGQVRRPAKATMAVRTFAYGDGPAVLHDVRLELRPGKIVALVGKSGSGKSTVASLLLGFYSAEPGSLRLNGEPYEDVGLDAVRAHFGIVPQDPYLFDGTVAENVAFGVDGEIDEARVREALAAAGALRFVEALPNGIRTAIGPRAARISGGQAQRLALARALYADRPIIVLDEAMSALDDEAEALVRTTLRRLAKDRAILIIGHRLTSVITADEICVLEEGRIVERGVHQEIVARGGVYAELFLSQLQPEELLKQFAPKRLERAGV